MKRPTFVFLVAIVALTSDLAAQGFGIAPHVGTLGVGADVGIGLGSRLGVRAGANFTPLKPSFTISDVKYKLNFPSPQFTAMVDLFLVGSLRLSGGARYSADDLAATGELLGSVTVGDLTYTSAEIGTLSGTISAKELAPYVGIGFGGPSKRGFGFFLDLGVAFQGTPTVTLASQGGTLSNDATLLQELAQEEAEIEDAITLYKYYPLVSLGFSIGF